jgi:ribosomal protein S18 acetylase RimI-like enzyme
MSDRLVKLYNLPDPGNYFENLKETGIEIRRAMAYEKFQIVEWVRNTFGLTWAGECDVAFSNHPISCFIATSRNSIAGFACFDSTYRNFFGPLGVARRSRRQGIGRALLLRCLYAMAENGFAYAIIGDSDKASGFYSSVIETFEIKNSFPGIYVNRLKNGDSGA